MSNISNTSEKSDKVRKYTTTRILADRHQIIKEYATRCKPRTSTQRAFEEILDLGLTMKRLLPKERNGDESEGALS